MAFLLVTVRDLRVVTTSRAPLNIAAERVVLLDQLAPDDGAALFVRRARAARPSADLDPAVVAKVVARLDGLPLAIELAAARVRAMSLDELRKRLEDRFAVLRGRDRSSPARHQTLTAVIAWSWDLLAPEEQRALAWLSVFHDGFSAKPAVALLGPDATDLVEALVDQSLLSVVESEGVARFRMLETVREYATLRLAEAGDTRAALDAQTAWAVAMADDPGQRLFGTDQVAAVDEISAEENNLADVLRRCLVDDEPAPAVQLLATLGILWAITGNHPRVFALAEGAERMLERWTPPPELVRPTQEALGIMLSHLGILQNRSVEPLVAAMASLGPPEEPWARATYAMFVEAADESERSAAVLRMADDEDSATAVMGLQWAAVLVENEGDIDSATTYARRAMALADEETTPWQLASLHTHLALLAMNVGDHRTANANAALAWPLLQRLHAYDDALQVRAGMAMAALKDGQPDECEQILTEITNQRKGPSFPGQWIESAAHAELALARGDLRDGLRLYLDAVEEMRSLKFAGMEPSGLEPWTVVAEAAALIAHARHASTPEEARVRDELAATTLDKTRSLLEDQPAHLDYPVSGMSLAALAQWLFASDDPCRQQAGIPLLALADRFSYNRTFPVMAWGPLAEAAESIDPGRLDALLREYDGRPGPELLGEGIAALDGVRSSG
ncbi:MAG: Signal transduction response regulator / Disease resistance protein [Marmoricola sp.]|nr:Signal transduction response regulator / Disease resistance protein [Marmoricola sp.]